MYIRVILPAAVSNIYGEHALGYAMAASAGVVKAIVRFYRIDSDPALKAFKSRIPMNNGNWTEWSSICLKSYA